MADHNTVVPNPKSIQYKVGIIPVRGLSICFVPEATEDDRYAATQLQRGLFRRTGVHIPLIGTGTRRHISITLRRTASNDPLPLPGEQPGPQSREAYELQIDDSGVNIHSRSSAGVFYAVQTLMQLVEGEGSRSVLPKVRIKDWPSLAYRGTMVDMSEGQLATKAEVLKQLDQLAIWKGNQYYFYSEDSIQLVGFPLVNPSARFTQSEIQEIIAYARARHIDIVPCLELFGHQHDLFRIEKYSALADFPHGGEFDPANPEVKRLLTGWIDQYAAMFPSHFVHIGFDETWEISRAARNAGAGASPATLFLDQLNFVASRFQQHGKTVMAWADMMVKFPEIVPHLPSGLWAVPWYYEPDPDPEYKEWLGALAANNVPNLVAPGVNMWNEIAPDFFKTFRNIDTFLAAGKQAHTLGIINTMWTDDQLELRRAGWPGLAYGAAAGWQSEKTPADEFFRAYANLVYGTHAGSEVAEGLLQLSYAEVSLQSVWGPETMIKVWEDPFRSSFWSNLKKHEAELRDTRLQAEAAEEHFANALTKGADPIKLNAFLFASRMLDYAGMKGLYTIEIGDLWHDQMAQSGANEDLWERLDIAFSQTHGRVGDLLDFLSVLAPEYEENWRAEYTPYRLTTALLRFNEESNYWRQVQRAFQRFRQTYNSGPLPRFDELTSEK